VDSFWTRFEDHACATGLNCSSWPSHKQWHPRGPSWLRNAPLVRLDVKHAEPPSLVQPRRSGVTTRPSPHPRRQAHHAPASTQAPRLRNQDESHLRPSAKRYHLLLAAFPAPKITRALPRPTPFRCPIRQKVRKKSFDEFPAQQSPPPSCPDECPPLSAPLSKYQKHLVRKQLRPLSFQCQPGLAHQFD
jgi:hypothetical protein